MVEAHFWVGRPALMDIGRSSKVVWEPSVSSTLIAGDPPRTESRAALTSGEFQKMERFLHATTSGRRRLFDHPMNVLKHRHVTPIRFRAVSSVP